MIPASSKMDTFCFNVEEKALHITFPLILKIILVSQIW